MSQNNIPENDGFVEEDDDIMVTIDLEDGSTQDYDILQIFTWKDQDYIALMPLDADENPLLDEEIVYYKYFEDADGNGDIDNITDDDEYAHVAACFEDLVQEAYDEEIRES